MTMTFPDGARPGFAYDCPVAERLPIRTKSSASIGPLLGYPGDDRPGLFRRA